MRLAGRRRFEWKYLSELKLTNFTEDPRSTVPYRILPRSDPSAKSDFQVRPPLRQRQHFFFVPPHSTLSTRAFSLSSVREALLLPPSYLLPFVSFSLFF